MSILDLGKSKEERAKKELAEKVVKIVEKIYQIMKDDQIQAGEAQLVIQTLGQKVASEINKFVGPIYLNHLK